MPVFKIKRKLENKHLIEDKIQITLELISRDLKKEKRTLINKENEFKKYFRKLSLLNISKEDEQTVALEIKDYIRKNGYIKINNNILTIKGNKVIIVNK